MANRVHWQPGALLTANHFVKQDNLAQKAISEATYLPFNVSYGISQLYIDYGLLNLGELRINQCEIYFKDKYYGFFDSYSHSVAMDLQALEKASVTIYLNRTESATQDGKVPTCRSEYYLSESYQANALNSVRILQLSQIDGMWKIDPQSPPLLTCATHLLDQSIESIKRICSSIKHLLENEIVGESLMVNLMLAHRNLQHLLLEVDASPQHVHPYSLFEVMRQLYLLFELMKPSAHEDTAPILYLHNDPIASFDKIIDGFNQLLSMPVKKNFVELLQIEDSFIATDLPLEMLQAKEHLLVVQKTEPDQAHLSLSQIKLSSVSRNTHINQMSLSGAYLEALPDSGVHQLSHIKDAKVYKILPGYELDAILKEKNMMFEASEVNQNYKYLIYYR
ncbi:type VI secretion system baseplate subunit TssK [Vibrio sp. S4M6]|uniref:type VI secretion system baseplate subunit TssK n=1 Tax=Vibrio sinus TaxID=2946865 RepID=UPI00202A4691|nr:type VI secretion system baseplate subunit TssK [Vibrio sinus]MCL9781022.1 type VI secretion system baseplate subunit TssK [Vibrio sinus]